MKESVNKVPLLKKYINAVCEILNIEAPSVSYDAEDFHVPSMFASCDSEGTTIYLRRDASFNMDLCLAVAHELRHAWQIRSDKSFWLSSYKPREKCSSLEEYNLQPAELDANAFSCVVLNTLFGVNPLFQGLPESVRDEIYKRAKQIVKNNQ